MASRKGEIYQYQLHSLCYIKLRSYFLYCSKCIGYSPSDNVKMNDKSLTRRNTELFNPNNVLENLKTKPETIDVVELYLQVCL